MFLDSHFPYLQLRTMMSLQQQHGSRLGCTVLLGSVDLSPGWSHDGIHIRTGILGFGALTNVPLLQK